jgi:two-component system copper resistance phosphate regulon response regulator CusR
LARLQAIARRGKTRLLTALQVADLELDLVARAAHRNGKRLDLSTRDFALLSLLLRRQGEVLSRELILEQVWGINFDTRTNVVDVAIRRLREKVDKGHKEALIQTARGLGYVLKAQK